MSQFSKDIFSRIKNAFFLAFFVVIVFLVVVSFLKKENDKKNDIDLLIEDVTILTMNKNSEIIKNGWIAIKDDKIIGLGKSENNYHPIKIINAKNKVAMPGLVNTHSHVAMTLFQGIDDDSKLSNWLVNMLTYEQKINSDDVYWGSLLGEVEMIKSGTTTFNDMYFFEESVARSVTKTGIRAVVDLPFFFKKDELKIDWDFFNKYKNISTIKFSLTPNPLINFSKVQLEKISDEAKKNGFIVHMHVEEDREDKNDFVKKFGVTPLQLLFKSGIVDNRTIFAHGINFTDEEIKQIYEKKKVSISLNPKSNFKLTGSTASIVKMMNENLTLGIGTDGSSSSNSVDMFDQINFLAFITRQCSDKDIDCDNQNIITPVKIIAMATMGGAKSLGLENEIGSIEIGKKADIILIDFQSTELVPSYDVYSSLVYNVDGSNVSDSIINGKVIMQNRKLINIDEKEIIEKVNSIAEKIITN